MALSAAFRDHLLDLFAPLGDITLKSMFGGAGIYHKDQIFGLIIAERIYLKTDDVTRPAFEREGVQPFRYSTKNGEVGVMTYWELPERLLERARRTQSLGPGRLRDRHPNPWQEAVLSVEKGKRQTAG